MQETSKGHTDHFPQGYPKLSKETDLGESPKSQPIKPHPCDYSFEEWLKVKIGHTNVANFNREKVFNEWVLDSFDIDADYAIKFANPYSRRFDEYRRVFNHEVEQLSNEYILSIGKKGYVLDDVWEKYSFMEGRSFICIAKKLDDALPLGRTNWSQFARMIKDELGAGGSTQGAT
ncbi:hypothetical protein Tco_0108563 [Tanacetum coccineum]